VQAATREVLSVAFSDIDRQLLQRCLARQPRAWEDFVDRFLGLVVHVVNHTTRSRSIAVASQDMEDLAAEVFAALLADDLAVLRRFRGQSSLATYLTVIARRVVVRELLKRRIIPNVADTSDIDQVPDEEGSVEQRLSNREEVERLLDELEGEEADVVRLYHLEGKSYDEISQQTGVPTNSVGPTLSRARAKMRRQGMGTAAS
jgi:RNA polymerase sigma-70 factor (ECF subfamily)